MKDSIVPSSSLFPPNKQKLLQEMKKKTERPTQNRQNF